MRLTGGIRDELCAAGGPQLVGWTIRQDHARKPVMALYPFGQRFPNPSPPRFRRVLALVAHRYRFEVVSLQLLRPLELASAMTFEGYFIQVRDRDGKPYVAIAGASRGTMHGAQASAVDDEFPYAHG